MSPSFVRNKRFDIAGQILIPVVLLMLYLIKIIQDSIQAWVFVYFVLGGWQFISALTHLAIQRSLWSSTRKLYYWLLLATIILPIATVTINSDSIISVGLVILGWTAIMAIFYFTISILELRKWKEFEKEELRNAFNEESNESN